MCVCVCILSSLLIPLCVCVCLYSLVVVDGVCLLVVHALAGLLACLGRLPHHDAIAAVHLGLLLLSSSTKKKQEIEMAILPIQPTMMELHVCMCIFVVVVVVVVVCGGGSVLCAIFTTPESFMLSKDNTCETHTKKNNNHHHIQFNSLSLSLSLTKIQ